MLLDVRDADVLALAGRLQHQLERIVAGRDGAVDGVAGGLSQAGFAFGVAFQSGPRPARRMG
jgi:hypothetical protein